MAQGQAKGKTVKRVTNLDIIRRQGGEKGSYEFELTLDNSQDYVLQISTDEVSTVLRNFQHSDSVLFDIEKEDLIFEHFHG